MHLHHLQLVCSISTHILFKSMPAKARTLPKSLGCCLKKEQKPTRSLCSRWQTKTHRIYTFVPCNLHQFQFDEILQEGCLDVSVCGRPESSVSSFQSTKRLALPQFKPKRNLHCRCVQLCLCARHLATLRPGACAGTAGVWGPEVKISVSFLFLALCFFRRKSLDYVA